MNSSDETNQNGNSRNDRIKDVGITQNGMVYVSEKGEVHLAVCLNQEIENQCAQDSLDIQDLMNLVFQKPNIEADPINIVDQIESASQSVIHDTNKLEDLNLNVNLGEQFDQ